MYPDVSAIQVDQVEQVKALARENRGWRLSTSISSRIVDRLDEDDQPIVVLPMRDVWIDGVRFGGMRPVVCLSRKRLVAVSRPWVREVWEVLDRVLFVDVSAYSDRSFEITLSDGRHVKLRGLIGILGEERTDRLYAEISSGLTR